MRQPRDFAIRPSGLYPYGRGVVREGRISYDTSSIASLRLDCMSSPSGAVKSLLHGPIAWRALVIREKLAPLTPS